MVESPDIHQKMYEIAPKINLLLFISILLVVLKTSMMSGGWMSGMNQFK